MHLSLMLWISVSIVCFNYRPTRPSNAANLYEWPVLITDTLDATILNEVAKANNLLRWRFPC
jgi:hypothetical protein